MTEYIIEHISFGLHERPSNLEIDKILTLQNRAIRTMLNLNKTQIVKQIFILEC